MADISKIETPDGTTYNIKDATARSWEYKVNNAALLQGASSSQLELSDSDETESWTVSLSNHTHGNITNGGDITTTATIASGDRLVINDESASKINNSSITFGTSTSTYLRNDGTWGTPSGGGDLGFTIKYGVSTQFSANQSSTGTCKATYTGFTNTPTVVGTFRDVSSTTNQLVLMITARSATETTFTIRNNGTAKRTGYVDWIAIGT